MLRSAPFDCEDRRPLKCIPMPLRSLVTQLQQGALTGELLERSHRKHRLLMRGAGRASRALVASAMARRDERPLLVVVPTLEEAGRWTSLLELMGWKTPVLPHQRRVSL